MNDLTCPTNPIGLTSPISPLNPIGMYHQPMIHDTGRTDGILTQMTVDPGIVVALLGIAVFGGLAIRNFLKRR